MDIDNILIPTKTSSAEKNYKHFIGYLDDDYKIKPLRIMFLKTSAYIKSFDSETKWIYFSIEDDELLKKYNNWDELSDRIKKEFKRELIFTKTFLKTEIKSYGDEATYFHHKEMSEAGSNYICLAVVLIDFAL